MNITKSAADSIPIPTKTTPGQTVQKRYYDDQLKGFGIRVTSGGSKTFFIEKLVKGKLRRIKIGRYGELTVQQARKEAQILLGQIARGIDPLAEKPANKSSEVTLKEVADAYFVARKSLKPQTLYGYNHVLNIAFAHWLNKPLMSYDMSRACGLVEDWDWAFPENGLYEGCDVKRYFEDKDRYALLVKVSDELAGFVLIHKNGTNPNTDWNMGEFFIVAKFQGKGIGKQAAHLAWKQFPGLWEISVIPENTPALAFWRKSVSDFTNGQYSEEIKSVYPKHTSA